MADVHEDIVVDLAVLGRVPEERLVDLAHRDAFFFGNVFVMCASGGSTFTQRQAIAAPSLRGTMRRRASDRVAERSLTTRGRRARFPRARALALRGRRLRRGARVR
jgi:hypothetical protein